MSETLEVFMRRRSKMGRRYSRKLFSRTAKRTHKKNLHRHPMRGGFRI